MVVERSGIISIVVLLFVTLALFEYSTVLGEVIYGPGDRVRYRYVIRTVNETCIWVIRITIEWVNETHVKYSGGLEGLVSGGSLCQSLPTLLILGLSLESEKPVELNATTPVSRRIIINPSYTGTYTYENVTVTYYKGILVSYYQNATTPVVGQYELIIIDTSVEELKALLTPATSPTTTTTSPPTPTATPPLSPTETTQTTAYWTPSPTSTPLATTSPLITRESPSRTTTPPSGDVNTYLIFGVAVVIIALLIAFLVARRKR
jgi:hypothetical protein